MSNVFVQLTEREILERFWRMNEEQATAFFREYVAESYERLGVLTALFRDTAGGKKNELDYTPTSLVPLWRWAAKRINRRDYTPEELGRITSLPSWAQQEHLAGPEPFSEESMRLLVDIAYYFAEVCIRALPGVHWEVCNMEVKRQIDGKQPVLGGFDVSPINPRAVVVAAARIP